MSDVATRRGHARPAALVTIVCIFLDEERFLAEAIESVLAQDRADWELVLVDDGSRDGSAAIAARYAAADPRIRLTSHPGKANLGMSVSRNVGVAAGEGEFVTFIDADDRWPPDKLSRQIAILRDHEDIAMTAGAINYWESWRGGTDRVEQASPVTDRPMDPPSAFLRLYPVGRTGGPSVHAMIRKSAFEQVGGFEPRFTGFYEDQAFFAKIHAHASVWYSSEVWQDYRQHEDSCCARTQAAGTYREKRQDMLDWLAGYVRTVEVDWQAQALTAIAAARRRNRMMRCRDTFRRLLLPGQRATKGQ